MARWPVAVMLLAATLLVVSGPVGAQVDVDLSIRDVRLEPDGSTQLDVLVRGLTDTDLEQTTFRVLEDGAGVDEPAVETLEDGQVAGENVFTILALDASGSMRGEPIVQVRQAASRAAEVLVAEGIAVGLVSFATEPQVLATPTLDEPRLQRVIAGIEAGGWTALFDAVIASVRAASAFDGIGSIVVFADGEDNRSTATLEEAITAANDAGLAIDVVVLETERLEVETLQPLAEDTGGRLLRAASVDEVAAAFDAVVSDVANRVTLSYESDRLTDDDLQITVVAETPVGSLDATALTLNPRVAPAPPPDVRPPSEVWPPFLGSPLGPWIGVALAFLATLILAWVLLVVPRRSIGEQRLDRGLRVVDRRGAGVPARSGSLPTAQLTERAIELVARVPKPAGFEQRLQARIDRAAWPMRADEFIVLTIASGLLGALLVAAFTGRTAIGVLGGIAGLPLPWLIMSRQVDRRRVAFVEQLPGTLVILAGSLRGGYGLQQAIDAVVRESDDPTSAEFARVLAETRLGLPLEAALEGMAERLDSPDLRWVVMAIAIQKEVGGNLAELLTTVAATMRARGNLRRQIQTLSAEGRLSARVIGAMPALVIAALTIINLDYVQILFVDPRGRLLLVIALGLLVTGALWLRQLVRIEV